ncbi:MAG: permease-like cell division protein FtsX [Pseudomonadota bacterium]
MTSRNPLQLSVGQTIKNYFLRHFQTFLGTMGRLYANPVASLMTILVIGVALALPALLQMMVNNGTRLSGQWNNVYDISVFMSEGTSIDSARSYSQELISHDAIITTKVIPADDALERFKNNPDFGASVETLDVNPLPHVVVVTPAPTHTGTQSIADLKAQLQGEPNVDVVQSDGVWINRLNKLVEILKRSVASAFGLLALAVMLIVGNTIRLDIENRREEIIITKLVGGSNGFIRRPFLYFGAWYGFAGGVCALLVVMGVGLLLDGPVAELASLYGSDFALGYLSPWEALGLIGVGTLLGWLGAWLAAQRHLHAIEPR